jgi:hypothetical protein
VYILRIDKDYVSETSPMTSTFSTYFWELE